MTNPIEQSVITPEQVLQKWWGYESFRPMQREIIDAVLAGRDTLVLMPTGGGKSLTYQVPALMSEGLTIVVTPLIALMKDQVDRLRKQGIAAVAVHSGMDQRQIEIALDNCTYGDTKLLYIAPERLATEAFRVRLRYMKVSIIAVDEAHCISQWGYDFRPSYLRIKELRTFQPEATILALTASATDIVSRDIMYHLGFKEEHLLRTSFVRPNLSYVVRSVDDKMDQLLRVIRNVEGSGIIYVPTREGCEALCKQLKEQGESVNFYHAGLPSMERGLRQDEWLEGKTRIIVATNAFGMGIDKADVRFVIHYAMCDSLEAYYQEAGRAGRDGKRSYAVLLATRDDADRTVRLFKAEFPPLDKIKHIYELLMNHLRVAIGDGEGASFTFNIYDFCYATHLSISAAMGAIKILEQNHLLTLIEEHDNPAKLMFTCSRDSLYKLNAGGNDMDLMLRSILRLYNGVFTTFRTINEAEIAAFSHLTTERVHELLRMLWRMHVIRYIPASRTPMIYLDSERLPTSDLFIAPETYRHRYDMTLARIEGMLHYATTSDKCRSVMLQEYFGDKEAVPCGVCDVCLERRRANNIDESHDNLEDRIRNALISRVLNIKELVTELALESSEVVEKVDKMVREGKISLSERGKLKINE